MCQKVEKDAIVHMRTCFFFFAFSNCPSHLWESVSQYALNYVSFYSLGCQTFMGHKLTVSSGTTAYLSDGDTQVFPVQGQQKNECKDLTVSITGFSNHMHIGEFSSEDDVGMQ